MGIIRNVEVLTEEFIPSRVVHRDGQLKTIRDILKPILDDQTPRNAFLHGDPGTGKTCIVRYVVEELEKEKHVFYSYVNCWSYSSRYKILYNLLHDIGLVASIHRKGMPTDELIDKLKSKIKDEFFVVILDEVDRLTDDKILYDLINIKNICLILISNKETALHKIDSRIRSRLASAENIHFPKYRDNEIFEILKDRAEWGLMPNVVKNHQLERIAEQSSGDARVAIGMLRSVAEQAENNDTKRIPNEYIKSIPKEKDYVRKEASQLNSYQKIILDLLEKNKKMDAGDLFENFQGEVQKNNLERVVDRTFRKYTDVLVKRGLVTSSGQGRWRVYSIVK